MWRSPNTEHIPEAVTPLFPLSRPSLLHPEGVASWARSLFLTLRNLGNAKRPMRLFALCSYAQCNIPQRQCSLPLYPLSEYHCRNIAERVYDFL